MPVLLSSWKPPCRRRIADGYENSARYAHGSTAAKALSVPLNGMTKPGYPQRFRRTGEAKRTINRAVTTMGAALSSRRSRGPRLNPTSGSTGMVPCLAGFASPISEKISLCRNQQELVRAAKVIASARPICTVEGASPIDASSQASLWVRAISRAAEVLRPWKRAGGQGATTVTLAARSSASSQCWQDVLSRSQFPQDFQTASGCPASHSPGTASPKMVRRGSRFS